MAIWNVLTKELAGETEMGRAERVAFVRERPFVLAFLSPFLALLRFRLWLALVAYLVVSAVIAGLGEWLKVLIVAQMALHLGVNLLVALELSALRVWKLRRSGYLEAGVVAAPTREEAERRFFAHYDPAPRHDLPSARPPVDRPPFARPAGAVPAMGVIGSFPEPRAS